MPQYRANDFGYVMQCDVPVRLDFVMLCAVVEDHVLLARLVCCTAEAERHAGGNAGYGMASVPCISCMPARRRSRGFLYVGHRDLDLTGI